KLYFVMVSMEFHYRPSSRQNGKIGKIFLRIIYNRRSGNITFPFTVRREEWDDAKHSLVTTTCDPERSVYLAEVRKQLSVEKEVFWTIIAEQVKKGSFTVNEVIRMYRFQRREKGLVALVDVLSQELEQNGKLRTARAYRTSLRALLGFSGTQDFLPSQLTAEFLEQYERYMQSEKKSLNTISFYMRNLRAIYNKGIRRGYFIGGTDNPFAGVYTQVASTRKRALSKENIRQLESFLHSSSLQQAEKDALALFLFSFHARGMCFVDVAHLRKSDVHGDMLSYYRRKTGRYMEIRITSALRKYIQKTHTATTSPYVFNIIRPENGNQYIQYTSGLRRQNLYLNGIAKKVGLQAGLTTHMARHSWATIAKKEHIPIGVISEALGHSTVSVTYKYLDSFGISVLDDANQKVAAAVSKAV
ncbi:MAG: site-specific integrase, partial [Tannerellaceae bacterium]|nr:site-specific integrase [Tannerellaceae bacterium]